MMTVLSCCYRKSGLIINGVGPYYQSIFTPSLTKNNNKIVLPLTSDIADKRWYGFVSEK